MSRLDKMLLGVVGLPLAIGATSVFAQPAPIAAAPAPNYETLSTENMLIQEMKAHRDWQAKAMELDATVTALKTRLVEAEKAKTAPTPEATPTK